MAGELCEWDYGNERTCYNNSSHCSRLFGCAKDSDRASDSWADEEGMRILSLREFPWHEWCSDVDYVFDIPDGFIVGVETG